jgi:hypothetical protein
MRVISLMRPRPAALGAAAAMIAALCACAGATSPHETDRRDGVKSEDSGDAVAAPTSTSVDSSLSSQGYPASCELGYDQDVARSCLICTPRKFPIFICPDLPEGKSLITACKLENDGGKITCADAKKGSLSIDLVNVGDFERLDAGFPALKIFALSQLNAFVLEHDVREKLYQVLTFPFEHTYQMYTGKGLDDFMLQYAVMIDGDDAAKPSVQTLKMAAAFANAVHKTRAAFFRGEITEQQAMAVVWSSFTKGLPADNFLWKYLGKSSDVLSIGEFIINSASGR